MGGLEQRLIKEARQAGNPIPDRIKNKPILKDGLEIYLDAFFDLDTERSHGMGLTRIPQSKVREYAKDHGWDKEQAYNLSYFVTFMDAEHLKRLEAKSANSK